MDTGACVDIFGNEQADNLAKEARNSPQLSNILTLTDADAIARRKLIYPVKKHFIPVLNRNRVISTTIRIRHFKGMKMSPDGQKGYNTCPNCPDIQLSPNYILIVLLYWLNSTT
ncbi:RNase H domain-containing protein [Trichonephila clavipes]|nr:RNase H domain-containing protein [Trichonephila clavipes]